MSARLLVTRSATGRLEGSVTADDGSVDCEFSGTLELLRVLEDLAGEVTEAENRAAR